MDKTTIALRRSLEELRRDFQTVAAKWSDIRLAATNWPAAAAAGYTAGDRPLIRWIRSPQVLVSWLSLPDPQVPREYATVEATTVSPLLKWLSRRIEPERTRPRPKPRRSLPTVDDWQVVDDAGRRFLALAKDAGHVARAVLPGADRACDGAALWIEALFRFAWTQPQGTPLRAIRFVNFADFLFLTPLDSTRTESPNDPLPAGSWYSRLSPDAFRASVALIDLLLEGLPPAGLPPADLLVDGIAKISATEGVSAQDAAERIRPDDPDGQRRLVRQWQKCLQPKLPPPIGKCPNHSQRNLYEPAAILRFLKKVEGAEVDRDFALSAYFRKVSRRPRLAE